MKVLLLSLVMFTGCIKNGLTSRISSKQKESSPSEENPTQRAIEAAQRDYLSFAEAAIKLQDESEKQRATSSLKYMMQQSISKNLLEVK